MSHGHSLRPREEVHWLARLIRQAVGDDRLDRLMLRMEEKYPWLNPEPEDFCPWVVPGRTDRCTHLAGHDGKCVTERSVRNIKTGKTFIQRDYWLGINYDTGGES